MLQGPGLAVCGVAVSAWRDPGQDDPPPHPGGAQTPHDPLSRYVARPWYGREVSRAMLQGPGVAVCGAAVSTWSDRGR